MINFNDVQQPSNRIYELIQIEIQTVIDELTKQQGQGRLAKDISCAVENLSIFNDQLQTELEKLKENRAVSKAECNTVNESTLGHYHSAPALLA